MGLFDDDFFSTKPSKSNKWISSSHQRHHFPIRWIVGSFASGVFLILLMLLFIHLWSEYSNKGNIASFLEQEPTTNDRVVQAVDKVRPAVVSVISTKKESGTNTSVALGSGIIYQKTGEKAYIITNQHVIDGANNFEVVLSNGEKKVATVIGQDKLSDVALLQVDAADITDVAVFGNSDQLKVGETAIAIGNPLGLGFSQTITVGVISSPLRTIPVSVNQDGKPDWTTNVIQTDAAINEGNSGGALVNLNGKVIGINSAKVATVGVEGIGFAIPINHVKTITDSLMKYGKVKRPYIGMSIEDLQSYPGVTSNLQLPSSVKNGIVLKQVKGPAAMAGLKADDVIVELDHHLINTMIDFQTYLYRHKKIGDQLMITYYRDGKKETSVVTLTEN